VVAAAATTLLVRLGLLTLLALGGLAPIASRARRVLSGCLGVEEPMLPATTVTMTVRHWLSASRLFLDYGLTKYNPPGAVNLTVGACGMYPS
jgi:hypothetical protein